MDSKIVKIRTKNFSARPLKGQVTTAKRVVLRLGSTTPIEKVFPKSIKKGLEVQEINTVDAIKSSRSKLLMKECFAKDKVPQAEWWLPEYEQLEIIFWPNNIEENPVTVSKLPYPILAKRIFGFKGRGMIKLDNEKELSNWLETHADLDGWYIEQYMNYGREYRLHCTQEEVFMVWRKLRKEEATNRWFFNSSNCNWIGEDHELFDEPSNWKEVKKASINALKSVGLDIGAVDVRIQSSEKKLPRFIVCEVNSAPALGKKGIEKYKQIIKKLVT